MITSLSVSFIEYTVPNNGLCTTCLLYTSSDRKSFDVKLESANRNIFSIVVCNSDYSVCENYRIHTHTHTHMCLPIKVLITLIKSNFVLIIIVSKHNILVYTYTEQKICLLSCLFHHVQFTRNIALRLNI